MNKKDKSLLVYNDNKWDVVTGENINEVIINLSNAINTRGSDLLNGAVGPYMGNEEEFDKLPQADRAKIYGFNSTGGALSRDDAYEIFLGGRDVVIGTIKAAGCKFI